MVDLDPKTLAACAEWLQQAELVDVAADMLAALSPKPPTVRDVLTRWLDGRSTRIAEDAAVAVAHGLPSLAKNLEALSAAHARESASPPAGPEGDGMGELREAWATWLRMNCYSTGADIDSYLVALANEGRPAIAAVLAAVRALVERSGGR